MSQPSGNKTRAPTSASNTPYLIAIMVMALLTTVAIIVLTIKDPAKDNTQLISMIIGFATPTTVSLLALMKSQQTYAKAEETHLSVNSRLDDFIKNAQNVSLMQGREEGRQLSREEHETDENIHQ